MKRRSPPQVAHRIGLHSFWGRFCGEGPWAHIAGRPPSEAFLAWAHSHQLNEVTQVEVRVELNPGLQGQDRRWNPTRVSPMVTGPEILGETQANPISENIREMICHDEVGFIKRIQRWLNNRSIKIVIVSGQPQCDINKWQKAGDKIQCQFWL